jgi:hypothetical protein
MPLEREVLSDRPEAEKECPRAFRISKAAHATLTFARWLMAILSPVVEARRCFDEYVLYARQLRALCLCRRIAAQPIGNDLASSSVPCSSTARHSIYGSPRSVTNSSSRCQVLPGSRRTTLTRSAKPRPNLSHQHRIVSYDTITPRSKSNSSMSRKLN